MDYENQLLGIARGGQSPTHWRLPGRGGGAGESTILGDC